MNSRNKGKRGELEWARVCREHGYDCRRTAQYCGNTGEASDVVGLPGIHIEVKRAEKTLLYDWLGQAMHDAGAENEKVRSIPIVAHRRNNQPWVVIMDADDWFRLYAAYELNMTGAEIVKDSAAAKAGRCSRCGRIASDEAVFCGGCGAEFKREVVVP